MDLSGTICVRAPWMAIFFTTIWSIWLLRNKKIFITRSVSLSLFSEAQGSTYVGNQRNNKTIFLQLQKFFF
ncbi:hypothetical protein Tsubulata_037219 [Turnera subulata]|uniref:Uncharacterized protein n=1 Tax=Turnera subulata TaxID=218843 RepID=A0A9Q0FRI7_9ROSI|nr:hypothetical protein Tsubulata_037219 [Turnera subulata]